MKLFAASNSRYFHCQDQSVKMDFIIKIYTKRAESVKSSCSEITCNLKSVKNFMQLIIHKVQYLSLKLNKYARMIFVWCIISLLNLQPNITPLKA